MPAVPFHFLSDPDRAPLRRRIVSLALTIIAHILLLIMLLRLAPAQVKLPGLINRLITFNVLPEAKVATDRVRTSPTATAHKASAPPPPRASTPPPPIKLPAAPWVLTPGLEKFDVRQAPATKPADADAPDASVADSTFSGGDSKAVYGPSMDGGSPGGGQGERLYYAEWYRRPTNAELGFYLPKDRHMEGYGEIACQTIERFHVENCRELGETPGSGLARAVRQAAWQLLVRPPHIGGKSLVGAWVRIRIDYSEHGAELRRH